MQLVDGIGWVGAILLGLCGIPQAIKTIRDNHARGLAWLFVFMWWTGELLTLGFIFSLPETQYPLIANYVLNICIVTLILWVKIKDEVLNKSVPII